MTGKKSSKHITWKRAVGGEKTQPPTLLSLWTTVPAVVSMWEKECLKKSTTFLFMGFSSLQIQQIPSNLGHKLKHFTLLRIKPPQTGTSNKISKQFQVAMTYAICAAVKRWLTRKSLWQFRSVQPSCHPESSSSVISWSKSILSQCWRAGKCYCMLSHSSSKML